MNSSHYFVFAAFCSDDMRSTLDKILQQEFLSVSRKVNFYMKLIRISEEKIQITIKIQVRSISMFKTIIRNVMEAYKKTWVDSDRTEIFYCLQACRKVSILYLLRLLLQFILQAITFKSSLLCLYPLLYSALEIADPSSIGNAQ